MEENNTNNEVNNTSTETNKVINPVSSTNNTNGVINPVNNSNNEKKGSSLTPIIVIIAILVCGVGGFFLAKSAIKEAPSTKNDTKEQDKPKDEDGKITASNYEGIYQAENNKMYIHKESETSFYYMIGDNFQGTADVSGDTAKENHHFEDYFEFKLTDDGIILSYHTEVENKGVATDTGLYKKVCEYTKDNVYKEAVGDPKYLTESKFSGVYKSDKYTLYVYQVSEKEVQVDYDDNSDDDIFFSKKFTIKSDNLLSVNSMFEEENVEYELVFKDKSFTLKYYDKSFGFDEDTKKLALNYKYEKAVTQDEILNKFYSNY